MEEFAKKDEQTLEVVTNKTTQEVKTWTHETLDAAIAQIDKEIDALQCKRAEYEALKEKAFELGVKTKEEAALSSE